VSSRDSSRTARAASATSAASTIEVILTGFDMGNGQFNVPPVSAGAERSSA
jgi:hypothetical protein